MSRVEDLAEKYAQHIKTPWPRTVAGAQRVVMIVYDKELERTLLCRKDHFELATKNAGHEWRELDLSRAFSEWVAGDEYREAYFECPEDLQLKLEADFANHVAGRLREALTAPDVDEKTVVAIFGLGALFGFLRVSSVIKLIEPDIRGRLLLFFPGQLEGSNYRLLDARDGWNYLAVPITLHGEGAWV
jgi:hypothetical protein